MNRFRGGCEPILPTDGPTNIPPGYAQVRQMLQQMTSSDQEAGAERRESRRFSYPFLLQITPVDENETPLDEPITVVGKDLSDRGLGFFHQQPLPYRRVMAVLEDMRGQRIEVLMDITWCRFTRHGWYDSGARFLNVAVQRDGQEFQLPATG